MVRWELYKLIRQRRTFLGLGAAADSPDAVPVGDQDHPGGPPAG